MSGPSCPLVSLHPPVPLSGTLAGLRFETCLIYLDDIIIYGKTFEEELKRLEEVLCALDLPASS